MDTRTLSTHSVFPNYSNRECPDVYSFEQVMEEEVKYDFIVFGVTGYTGKFVAEEIYRIQNDGRQDLKWAVAGRSETKVAKTMQGSV